MAALPKSIRSYKGLARLATNRAFRKMVFARARREGWSPDRAEDLFQHLLLIVHRKITNKQHIKQFPNWIAKTTRYCVYSENRRAARQRKIGFGSQAEFDPPAKCTGALDAVANRNLVSAVGEALESVDARSREAILLRFHSELTLQGIADVLQVSVASAHRLVTSGLAQLRKRLAA